MEIDFIQNLAAQIVLFQQMTEAQNCVLVGSRGLLNSTPDLL